MEGYSFFDIVKKDHQNGSTRILDQAIWATKKTLEQYPEGSEFKIPILDELENVEYHHPDLVILQHFVKNLKSYLSDHPEANVESTIKWIDSYNMDWKNVNERIANNFLDIVDLNDKSLMFHSHSGTIVELGKAIAEKKLNVRVFQTRSEPGGEGILQAAEFKNHGFDVKIVPDEEIANVIPIIDFALFGADQISVDRWTNKIGTRAITSLCQEEGKQVWVLCDSRKRVEETKAVNEIFEETDLSLATGMVTENIKI